MSIKKDMRAACDALATPPRNTDAERERMARAFQGIDRRKAWAFALATFAAFLIVTLETGGAF
jgi:hypothetical protein